MILLFVILTILLQGLVMGCFAYCGVKIYTLPHFPRRWRLYLSTPFFVVAIYLLVFLVTSIFTPRPMYIVWWTVIARFVALLILAAGVGLATLFFFGWINGVGKLETKNDPE